MAENTLIEQDRDEWVEVRHYGTVPAQRARIPPRAVFSHTELWLDCAGWPTLSVLVVTEYHFGFPKRSLSAILLATTSGGPTAKLSRGLEGITSIEQEDDVAASGCQNRPDPTGRLHTLVGPRIVAPSVRVRHQSSALDVKYQANTILYLCKYSGSDGTDLRIKRLLVQSDDLRDVNH